MTPRDRIKAVLDHHHPDRIPVSFWYHFPPNQVTGQAAIDAHLKHLEEYDLDFLKVMNDHPFPRGAVSVVQSAEDLGRIKPIDGDVPGFAGQLQVLTGLRQRLGPDVPLCTTLFNAWTLLRQWTVPPSDRHGPPKLDAIDDRDRKLTDLLNEDRSAMQAALMVIAESQARFAAKCIEAGADGVFLSVRDDWVDRPGNGENTYDELVKPADLHILEAARAGSFNVVHACGKPLNFQRFGQYPCHALSWADRASGPSIAYARDRIAPAIMAGVDNLNTLPNGSPEDCAAEVRDALRQAQHRSMIIAPGCTFDPELVPAANLKAVVAEARKGR